MSLFLICTGEIQSITKYIEIFSADFTATPLKKSISHCQAYIYFIIFIDLLINLLNILCLDICEYHISLKRAFYAEKSDIQYIYRPFNTLIYNPGHTGIPVKRLQSSVAVNGKNDYSRRRQ